MSSHDNVIRVFTFLAHCSGKHRIERLERDYAMLLETKQELPKTWSQFSHEAQVILNDLGDLNQLNELEQTIQKIKNDVAASIRDVSGIITTADMVHACKEMQLSLSKVIEIDQLIWEVDDDMDGGVNFTEFKGMLDRCRSDKQDLEPCQLYLLVEFLLCDYSLKFHLSVGDIAKFHRWKESNVHKRFESIVCRQSNMENLVSLQTYWTAMNTGIPKLSM
ncbi:hypothetical protein THRCLA_20727 [Thraustotheca clavata]|uniref:EF-hand domain-containing protein n=1 Tax=Thraustotheca clavata TaxID=74557 RepID=A0A1W0A454_9STRA|nr:hypothetical protein THRCLA_20727 [Thraustotheca clavata]